MHYHYVGLKILFEKVYILKYNFTGLNKTYIIINLIRSKYLSIMYKDKIRAKLIKICILSIVSIKIV